MVYQYSRARVERDFEDDGVIETVREKLLWLRIPRLDQGGALRDIEEVDLREETGDERWYWEQYENCNGTTLPDECPYREKETVLVTYTPEECLQPPLKGTNACQEVAAHARFEFKQDSQADARTQLIRMAVVCFVLLTLSLQFQTDTQILVIAPIEKMVNIIKQLAEDPLRPPDAIVVEDVVEVSRDTKKKKGGPQLETSMSENTILRIGELLQRGFGAAGAEIVGANMSSGDGDLNIMTPGQRVTAIFGWTNVRDFTYATGVLEEDVVCFVNTIGRIVQGCVRRWSGVANKNIGDAFVVLWKVPEMDLSNQKKNGNTAGATAADTVNKISETSDRALMGFVKILAECRRSADIDFYNGHHQLRKGRPRWRVRIGMALHVGWAIEGPIGSDYKIDASYLSPAVSMCEMLECSTKVYGTPLISSESHYKLLSLRAKERMRKIDVVKMMDMVTGLYAYNVNFASRIDDRATEHFEIGELSKDEGLMDISSETLEKEGAEFLFVIDRDVAKLQEGIPEELNLDYREALCQLLEGNWDAALEVLVRILREIWPGDGPSEALYRFMKESNFKCPANWNGYHVLDDDALARATLKEPIIFVEEETDKDLEQQKKPTSRSAAAAAARRQSVGESVGDD